MNTTTFTNRSAWARAQWAGAALGDRRRSARAVRLGAALAAHPAASWPTQTEQWGDLKAAYRLLNEPDVTHAALSQPHWEQPRAAAAGPAPVLFIQDTTELDYTAHRQTQGLGHIGDGRGRGFEVQSCLAVQPADESRAARWARERESAVWGQV